jgi:hypothetical protein
VVIARLKSYRVMFTIAPRDNCPGTRVSVEDRFARYNWEQEKSEELIALVQQAWTDKEEAPSLLAIDQPRRLRRVTFEIRGGEWHLRSAVLLDETAETRLHKIRAFFEVHGWLTPRELPEWCP